MCGCVCVHIYTYRHVYMHVCKYDITNEALLHYSLHNGESWPPRKERLMISILDGQMIVQNVKYGLLSEFL